MHGLHLCARHGVLSLVRGRAPPCYFPCEILNYERRSAQYSKNGVINFPMGFLEASAYKVCLYLTYLSCLREGNNSATGEVEGKPIVML